MRKPPGYWTKEKCEQESKKYKTRSEFSKYSNGAYTRACKNKWIDEYTWLPSYRNFDEPIDNVYVYIFEEYKSVYVGRTIDLVGRDWTHIFTNDSVSKFALSKNVAVPKMIVLENQITIREGLKKEHELVEYYKENGYHILNKAKTGLKSGSIGALNTGKWTYEECFKLALECTCSSEMGEKSEFAYKKALKRNWLKDYTWFESKKKKNYWNYEHCYEEAKKYKTIKEFENHCMTAYMKALDNGWLKDYTWFKRQLKPYGYWTLENIIEEIKDCKKISEVRKKHRYIHKVICENKWNDIIKEELLKNKA